MRLTPMKTLATAVGVVAALSSGGALAQANEQFFPAIVYRTGPYAPNGTPFANGFVDYLKLVNARDGGINGVKISWEECDTGYDTARTVECYERLKGKGPTGATAFHPLSTGGTFALIAKSQADKIPLITLGYGRGDAADGEAFPYTFPLLGTYWIAADILVQHVGKLNGGVDKLKGKKITLVYHDSPYGKEPITLLQERAKMHGFELQLIPVTHPGVEQKAAWLQIRQSRPDYVFLWGWGVMNSTAIKEAVATGYPREKMFGVWWSGAEPDVAPVGADAKGYNALALVTGAGRGKVHEDILKHVHAKGQGTGPEAEVGQVLYNRGILSAMVTVEAVRRAQEKFGKKPLTGEQVHWGLENLSLDEKRIEAIGFGGLMRPVATSCNDHVGNRAARVQTWDGSGWKFSTDWYEADAKLVGSIVKASAAKYLEDQKLPRRNCAATK